MTRLRRTPLHDIHLASGARMVGFGGWTMPSEYAGIVAEHKAVRSAVGVFDVSHMGEFFVRGPQAEALVQSVTSNDVGRLEDGRAHYSALPTDKGTIVDDLLVYRFGPCEFMLVVNASRTTADLDWIRSRNRFDAEVEDASDRTGMLAVQGPRALHTLASLTDTDLVPMRPFSFSALTLAGVEGILSRTGYTGEDGFEFYFDARMSEDVWTAILSAGRGHGILPAGLGARNTLRLEAGLLLYGSDIDETTTLFEAGLGWITKLDKGDFVGRDALVSESRSNPRRRLVGFEMLGREIARDGYSAFLDDRPVGVVTSGSPSITLGTNIGRIYLPIERSVSGTRFQVEIRHRRAEARVVDTPFYTRRY